MLRGILKVLISDLGSAAVGVSSPVGLCASHISGVTVHAWAGLTPRMVQECSPAKAASMISREARQRVRTCRVLAVDELSMLDEGGQVLDDGDGEVGTLS
jgi:hypothetical protein